MSPVTTFSRRHFLAMIAPGLAVAALLPACGRATESALPAVGTPGVATTTARPSPSVAGSPSVSAATGPTPTPTLSATRPLYLGDSSCFSAWNPDHKPSDPYRFHLTSEGAAIPFSEKVRRYGQLIVLGTVRDILPARWTTADGNRPADPHRENWFQIITPVRVQVERVAAGSYALPDIYLAAPGGQIGADCASYTGTGPRPTFVFGARTLYFLGPSESALPGPVPTDDRYHYYRPNYSYTAQPDGTITIGPEYDIMGHRADDPPRTLTVDQTLQEIAALLAAPTATPTR